MVLKRVRPDWTPAEVRNVQDKLAEVQIESPEGLFQQLRDKENGVQDLNRKLRAAGQRAMRAETLEALRDYSMTETRDPVASSSIGSQGTGAQSAPKSNYSTIVKETVITENPFDAANAATSSA